jgi:DNA-binding NarL/FixJ family response regulator
MDGIRVVVFDDNSRVRDALSMLINGTDGFELIKAFPDCMNLRENLESAKPDVVLMDIDMPGINGIEGVKLITKYFPNVQILMQTVFDDDSKIFDSIVAGAGGYILKKTTPSQILEAIREVYNGGAPMTPGIARRVLQMFSQRNAETEKEEFNLSKREKEVLQLLVNGKSYKMIADELCISYETVRAHMKKIYEKLHVSSMTEAVAKAINKKIFSFL